MLTWREKLYIYGFLMTDDKNVRERDIDIDWEKWKLTTVGAFDIWLHPLQKLFVYDDGKRTFLLIGHAYDPFTMESDENVLLKHLAERYGDESAYYDYFDGITGVFFYAVLDGDRVISTCDCAGMMGAYYGVIDGKRYYSAYCQMIADLCGLKEDEYVTRLKRSKLFHLYGWYLPGDLSSYKEVRRIIPNTEAIYDGAFSVHRFYPRKPYDTVSEEEYPERVAEIGRIFHNTMVLISEKWEKPAISMSGGTDSKTTLACTSDVQNRFGYYSYISLGREGDDAYAAREICTALGLEHEIYEIDTDKTHHPDFDEADRLIERHYGYLGKGNVNDVCKRIELSKVLDCDVEVKSWVSEVARASRYGKYNKTKLPEKMTPRRLTSMYKVFAFNRKTAMDTDKVFAGYMQNTGLREAVEGNAYPWSEFFVWEIVFGGWGGLVLTGEHKLSNDITVPYNNRALLDLMLRTPLEKRRTDELYRDIVMHMDRRIQDTGIHVVNGNETRLRAICEGLYFDLHSLWPW